MFFLSLIRSKHTYNQLLSWVRYVAQNAGMKQEHTAKHYTTFENTAPDYTTFEHIALDYRVTQKKCHIRILG